VQQQFLSEDGRLRKETGARQRFLIEGGVPLKGTVRVAGAKNAVLPMMAAALLADGPCRLKNVPRLGDIATLAEILRLLGMRIDRVEEETLELQVVDDSACRAPYELVRELRGSICVLGPLLARRGRAEVAYPGGCTIGVRPIDLHLKGMKALGAQVDVQEGYICARGSRLRGASVFLSGASGPTVLGTANVMMAACLAEGQTVIEEAVCEPEVQQLARFLNAMGAAIQGVGTRRLTIEGVKSLHGAEFEVIPDRIEAATFMAAAAITRGHVRVQPVRQEHLGAVLDILRQIGVAVEWEDTDCRVAAPDPFRPVDVSTAPYPGFPTDVQPQLVSLLALAHGTSVVTEKVFPDRFAHLDELNRMRANIRKSGPSAIITGVEYLSGAPVQASDLRAGAALVLAGLVARGQTTIAHVHHIDRGYQNLEAKLRALGARIQRVEG
jgi:UDP-N-acetylglucosamine 1-carboxyvinyltransferase